MQKILFMGTPDFSVPILKALIEGAYQIVGVVTQPDRPVGRKRILTASPVKQVALEQNIPVFQPEKLVDSPELDILLGMDIDLIVTAAYGQFLPQILLEHSTYKPVNVHASLLPKYRGGAPIQYALMNGDRETGVSIMYMEKAMDAGDILSQASIPILPEDNVSSLFDKLSLLGRDLLLRTLPDIFSGQVEPQPQDPSFVTFSPALKREAEKINWSQTALQIHNQVRAMNAWPGAYTFLDGQRFKIWQTEVVDQNHQSKVGTIVKKDSQALWIACGEGTVLALKEVQPAGKNKQTILQYLQGTGNYLKEGESLGIENETI